MRKSFLSVLFLVVAVSSVLAQTSAAVKTAESLLKAYGEAENQQDQEDMLYRMQDVLVNLHIEGENALQQEDYTGSAKTFQTFVMIGKFLRDKAPGFAMEERDLQSAMFYAGFSLLLNEAFDAAEPYFNELYAAGYHDAGLYDALYQIARAKENKASAAHYLTEGRAKFPDEPSLLFAEINLYLSEGRLAELTGNLQEAINKEPDNVSLYVTLGNVYENLYRSEYEGGNTAKASEYFALAQAKYEEGLKVDPNNTDLNSSLGSMFYNRAAVMTQELNELDNDFSREGMNKYELKKTEIIAEFEKALPYFQKVEMANPNDFNTLIALKNIYDRMGEHAISDEFKIRPEKVQRGETLTSYFRKKGR